MYRKAFFCVIVYVVLNLATLYASSDPIEKEKYKQLVDCFKDTRTSVRKVKICLNETDLENAMESYMHYLSKTNGNRTVHVNKLYLKIIKDAFSDNRTKIVDESLIICQNKTAVAECQNKQYEVPENVTLKTKIFSKTHEIVPTRSSCSDSKKIYECMMKNGISSCGNIVMEYFEDIFKPLMTMCSEVVEDTGTPSDGNGGASSYLQTSMRSIVMTLFIVLLF